MKTLGDLNKKISYRLAKVIYFIIFLFVFINIGDIFFQKSITHPYNNEKAVITCLSGPNKNDTLNERIHIKKDKYGITDKLDNQQKELIAKEVCGVEASVFFETETPYSDLFLTHNDIFIVSKGAMEQGFNLLYFISACFALLLAGLVATEILKRVTYYIFLGTFTPHI